MTDSPSQPKKQSPDQSQKTAARSKTGAAKKDAPKAEQAAQKLRIRVRAYEYKVLDLSVKQIMDTVMRYEAEVIGPVPLPVERKTYTVNRSAFVYEDSREQFEMRVHKRLIDILNPSQKIIESLSNLNLPSGVSIDVKII